MNDREHYHRSPAAKFSIARGDFDPTQYMSRTFNRRMRMRDTFTQILPTYNHVDRTCMIPTFSHTRHEPFSKGLIDEPIYKVKKEYNHRMDRIKDYNEEMQKLGVFAPQPIKHIKPPAAAT